MKAICSVPSCAGSTRASTSYFLFRETKTWMAGSSPAMTKDKEMRSRSTTVACRGAGRLLRRTHEGRGPLVGSTQQGQQAAAGHRPEQVDEDRQNRQRRADPEAEKRHGRWLKVLEGKDQGRDRKHDDHGQVNLAHVLSSWCGGSEGRIIAAREFVVRTSEPKPH